MLFVILLPVAMCKHYIHRTAVRGSALVALACLVCMSTGKVWEANDSTDQSYPQPYLVHKSFSQDL